MRVFQNASGRPVAGVAFAPNGRTLYAGGDGGFQAWPLRGTGAPRVIDGPAGKLLYGFEADPGGKYVYAANQRAGFAAYDLRTGARRPLPDVVSLSAHPDGSAFAVCRGGATVSRVECWDVEPGGAFVPRWRFRNGALSNDLAPIYIDPKSAFCEAVRFAPDGRTLAVVEHRCAKPRGPHVLAVHDAATGKRLREVGTLPVTVGFRMRYTPDGKRLIGWESWWAEVWDVAGRKQVGRLTPPGRAQFQNLAVHPSGRSFATVAADGKVRTWDLKSLTEITATDLGVGKLGVRQVIRYLPLGFRGRMVMSYLGSAADRSSRASTGRISALVSVTPPGYSPDRVSTTGVSPCQVIRRAYPRMTPRLVSSPPRHFRSSAAQHRSTGLYLLWYGG
jgi:hypothetical protein